MDIADPYVCLFCFRRYNNLTQEGAEALAYALERNTTLQDLQIADNHFGRIGVMRIYKCMKGANIVKMARAFGYTGQPVAIRMPDSGKG